MSSSGPERGPTSVGTGGSEPPTPSPRRRRWPRLVFACLVAAAGLIGLVHLPPVRHGVRDYLVDAMRARFDTVLAIGQLDYNLLTLSVTVHDVSAAATRAPTTPFFRADRVAVQFRPSTLFGSLAFSSIDLVRPRLSLTRDADGRYRLPTIRPSEGPTSRFLVDRLSIAGLDLQVDGTPPVTIDARNVSASLEPRGAHIQGMLQAVSGARLRTPAGADIAVGVDGVVGLSPDTVLIDALTLTLPGSRVEVRGALAFAPGPSRLDLSYRGSLSLADATSLWPTIAPASGQVAASGTLAGPLSDLALTFDASSASAVVRGIAAASIRAQGTVGHGAAALDSASFVVAGGRIDGTASFALGAGAPSMATVEWREVGLGGLLKGLDLASPLPLSSRLAGRAAIRWSDEGLPSLRVDATLGAAAGPQAEGLPLGGRSVLNVTGERWTLGLQHLLGDGTSLVGQLSGVINRPRFAATTVGGRVETSVGSSDMVRAIALVPAAPDALRRAAARLHGDVSARLDLSGLVSSPSAAATIDGSTLQVDGFGDARLRVAAKVDGRGARIDELAVVLPASSLTASGFVPFDRRPADLAISAQVSDVAWWLEDVPARWRASGPLSIDGTVSGPLTALRMDGRASSSQLAWPFWKPGAVDADVHLSGGGARFDARVPSVRGGIQGQVALSSPFDFDFTARVDAGDLARLADIAAGLGAPRADCTGTATASVRLVGHRSPDQTIDIDLRAEALSGTINAHDVRLLNPARIVAAPERLSVERLRFQLGGSTVSAAGSVPAGGDGPLRIEADGDLHEWWTKASGRIHAALQADGSPRKPVLAGDATVSAASVAMEGLAPVTGIGGTVRLANDVLDFREVRATWSGAEMTAQGHMPVAMVSAWLPEALAPPAAAGVGLELRASLSSLTEKAFEPWLDRSGVEELHGTVSAQLDLRAPSLRLDALSGTAVITQSDTTFGPLALSQPAPARVTFAGGRIQVEDAEWRMGARTLRLSGGVDVRGEHPLLDLALAGEVDLGIARAFFPLALSGTAAIDARVTGDARRPSFAGGATLTGVSLGFRKPRVSFSGGTGRLTLEKDRLVMSAQGNMNGGTVQLSGALALRRPDADAKPPGEILRARATSFLLEWPDGLRSTVDADLTYSADAHGGLIAGQVQVQPGAYRRATMPSFADSGKTAGQAPALPSHLDATRLDVAVSTRAPGLVDNSYARVEVDGAFHVGGTVGQPTFGGRLQAREDGEVYLRGNVFRIDRGSLEFTPEPGATPSISLLAATRRSGYDIRLRLGGRIDDLRVVLTSDPPLAQPDLMALVTTGSTSNSMSPGTTSSTGGGQDALVAAISSDVLGLAGKTVGLDSVRVGELELDLMGDDVDPETRLTIGKSVASWLDLLLSQNLRESGFTWAVTVHPYGGVQVRFVSADSKTNSIQVAHEIIFGQPGGRTRAPVAPKVEKKPPRVTGVTVSGGGLPERDLLDATKVRPGDRFDFFEWQRDHERVEELLHSRGYLQAQVSATREAGASGGDSVTLRYEIRRGPISRLRVTGFTLPEPVVEGMKAAWSQAVDDRFLQDDLRDRALGALADLGYLWPEVAVEITTTTEPGEKTADVRITPGAHAASRQFVFNGARTLPERDLRDELERSGVAARAWREPAEAAAAVQQDYRRRGFLAAKVSAGPVVPDGDTARLPLEIEEGPRHVVSRIEIRGGDAADVPRVEKWLAWKVGTPFDPGDGAAAAKRIQAGYAADGYRTARASVSGKANGGGVGPNIVNVTVTADVEPGIRSVVGAVEVIGRGETREAIVRRAIDMPKGSAASPAAADRAQRRLYETEAFRSVDMQMTPMADEPGAAAAPGAQPPAAAREQPTKVVVTLEEAPLYRLRYGVQLTNDLTAATQTNDLRPGVSAELRRRNLFGTALNGGVGGRYEVDNWNVRAALNIPTSVLWPALSSVYFKQSKSTDQGDTGPVVTIESSLTYQERWRLGQKSELSYGYTFTREDLTFDTVQLNTQSEPGVTHRGNLFAALAWDHRDSVFDATRGWFHSSSLEYGEPALGSDFSYLRYLFQQTYYRKVAGIVLAGAARTGVLVHVTGTDDQTYSLRFRTGGDRTVRGYEQESLSAPGESGAMVGGRALLVLNGELRFPVWKWVKAATFLDAGNAFVDPQHMSLKDLKVGTGFGIRLDTPYALFRFDLGFPLPQTSGPVIRRWYFSIGQSF